MVRCSVLVGCWLCVVEGSTEWLSQPDCVSRRLTVTRWVWWLPRRSRSEGEVDARGTSGVEYGVWYCYRARQAAVGQRSTQQTSTQRREVREELHPPMRDTQSTPVAQQFALTQLARLLHFLSRLVVKQTAAPVATGGLLHPAATSTHLPLTRSRWQVESSRCDWLSGVYGL